MVAVKGYSLLRFGGSPGYMKLAASHAEPSLLQQKDVMTRQGELREQNCLKDNPDSRFLSLPLRFGPLLQEC